FVGGADPRKNHQALLQAYASKKDFLKEYCIVVVGSEHHRFGDVRQSAAALGVQDRVMCTGLLELEDLRLLYSHAEVMVFPSIYEGFGMPVLEAMACGAPVITSDSSS